ncbi:MAG: DUF190 domain-containing protein [Pseudomonadota bacterium]|nr:DUF190 domain-containing protein [Pseudomonadota bacterium]MDP1903440.1 DUF190 domain-containing protein [Pseudomonadota bacterium]MDP2352277.1 DUF190 domain-containing protein [Pseudomonadota bacterium]
MQTTHLRFYVREGMKHEHQPLRDWLFDTARELGIPGGTVFRAAAGYGRHGLHEDHFFELAGELPETVEFFAESDTVNTLIEKVGKAGLRLIYITQPVSAGVTGT